MKGFSIELNTPSHSYFSGGVVQGNVIVETEKPIKIKELSLILRGTGRVHWSLTETFSARETTPDHGKSKTAPLKQSRVVAYSENEKYIFEKVTLFGDGKSNTAINGGTTYYPFQFQLPANCPSTFTTKFGFVAYFLEAELKRPFLKRDRKTTISFTVNGMLNLNSQHGAKQPQQMQKTKGSNLLACRSGQLGFVLRLPKTGYVAGEILDFSSDINNQSNREITEVKAILYQAIKFQTKIKFKVERRIICVANGPEISTGERELWKPDNIEIPNLPPTGLGGMCRIIDVQYFLRFEANISGLSKSLWGELPVMIGTIALTDSNERLQNPRNSLTPRHTPYGDRKHEVRPNTVNQNGEDFTDICHVDNSS